MKYQDQLTYEEKMLFYQNQNYYHYKSTWKKVNKLKIIESNDKNEVERQTISFINHHKIINKEITTLNISDKPHYQVSLWYEESELDDYVTQMNDELDELLAKSIIDRRPKPPPEPEHIGAPIIK